MPSLDGVTLLRQDSMGRDRQVRYSERMRNKGFVRAQLWVPVDEIELFTEIATMARDRPLFWKGAREQLLAILRASAADEADGPSPTRS